MEAIIRKVNLSFLKNISLILLATIALLFFVYATPNNEGDFLERIYVLENKTNTNINNVTLYNTIKDTILSLVDTYNIEDNEEYEDNPDYDDYDVENKTIDEIIDEYESIEEVATIQSTLENHNTLTTSADNNITYKDVEQISLENTVSTEKILSKKDLDKIWLKKMEDRFESRRVTLKAGCKKHRSSINYSVKRTLHNNIYMAKKYDLLVCAVAKAGSSTWKTHLLTLNGYKINGNVHSSSNERKIRAGSMVSRAGVQTRMNNNAYTRVMNARHPLDRLVSAYRDKYHDGGLLKNSASQFQREAASHLYKTYKRINFEEFLKIVIRDQWAGLENAHWRNYYRTCSPCQLTYDYIMKVETYSEDLSYIFRKLGVTEINPELRKHGKAPISKKAKYEKYYDNIPEDILKKIHQLYKEDYELFGYDVPKFVKRAL